LGKTELELKLVGPPAVVAAAPQRRFFRALKVKNTGWERLTSTYYDTPAGALRQAALSLRLREETGGFIQAVKRANGAGPVKRLEYETEIESEQAFPAKTGEKEIDDLISTLNAELKPVARTTVDRWAAIVRYGESSIEFAIDLGRAEGWTHSDRAVEAPIAETELELIKGRPRDVFELARLVADNAPLRLSMRSKLDFALSLAKGGAFWVDDEERLLFEAQTPAVAALQETLGAVAARLASLQPAMLDARKAEGVHQMRVALRRLQAVERIFRPYLKTRALRDLAAKGRDYRKAMGGARDWDVFLDETLPAATGNNCAPKGVQRLRARAEMLRAEAWARAVAELSAPGFTMFLIDLAEAANVASWRSDTRKGLEAPLEELAPQALEPAYESVLKTAQTIDRDRLSGYHPLRIALKKLRYPVQMFRTIYPKSERKEFMGALAKLQVDFGGLNDAVVAETLADEAAKREGREAMRAAGFICGYHAAAAEAAARAIVDDWPAFEKMTPFWRV